MNAELERPKTKLRCDWSCKNYATLIKSCPRCSPSSIMRNVVCLRLFIRHPSIGSNIGTYMPQLRMRWRQVGRKLQSPIYAQVVGFEANNLCHVNQCVCVVDATDHDATTYRSCSSWHEDTLGSSRYVQHIILDTTYVRITSSTAAVLSDVGVVDDWTVASRRVRSHCPFAWATGQWPRQLSSRLTSDLPTT